MNSCKKLSICKYSWFTECIWTMCTWVFCLQETRICGVYRRQEGNQRQPGRKRKEQCLISPWQPKPVASEHVWSTTMLGQNVYTAHTVAVDGNWYHNRYRNFATSLTRVSHTGTAQLPVQGYCSLKMFYSCILCTIQTWLWLREVVGKSYGLLVLTVGSILTFITTLDLMIVFNRLEPVWSRRRISRRGKAVRRD